MTLTRLTLRIPGLRPFRRQALALILLAIPPLSLSCRRHRDTLESAGRAVAVHFPSSSRLIGIHHMRGIDEWIGVKVEMSAADCPGFLATTPITPELFEAGAGGKLGSDFAFWDPHKAKHLRTAQASLPPDRVLTIGYDDSRGDVIVVYVVNHGH